MDARPERLLEVALPPVEPAEPRRPAGADRWQERVPAGATDSLSRLGAALFGSPLQVTLGEGVHRDALAQQAFLNFSHSASLVAGSGETLGSLSLLDLAARPPLDAAGQRRFADLANLTTAWFEACAAIDRHDHVTGLPNRQHFLLDMGRRKAEADSAEPLHLLLVTLSDARQFNEILRALGHGCADDFVRAGAELVRGVAPAGRLYHVSVLSFAFLLQGADSEAEAVAERLVAAFARPLVCQGVPIATRAGVGIAGCPQGPFDAAEPLRNALAAAQDARGSAAGWSRYDRRTDEAHRRAFMLLANLRQALIASDQLSLAYQPRVDMKSGRCVSAEALIRWRHPVLGAISPGEFVPLVEATALIGPMTDWVMDAGIRQIAQWSRAGIAPVLALNVSPNNLRDANFTGRLTELLERHHVEPHQIELEFTEGALTTNEPQVRAAIARIRDLGIDIAIDDFGTGYSNISYLTGLPAQIIKIDQSFIRTLEAQPRQQLLVRAMMEMAHRLGFRVVAEGIETTDAYGMLSAWGCEQGQGYLMSKPLTPGDFAIWFSANNG